MKTLICTDKPVVIENDQPMYRDINKYIKENVITLSCTSDILLNTYNTSLFELTLLCNLKN